MLNIEHSKIGLLSFYTRDFQSLHDINGPIKDKYCQKWGYKHIVKTAPYGNPADYYAFSRLRYIHDLFFADLPEGCGIEVIFCLNGHAQIMNHTIQIEEVLDEEHDFFIAKNCNGTLINAGSFIIRKSDWSRRWLNHLLSYGDEHHNYSEKEQNLMIMNENNPEFKDGIKILPQTAINAHYYDLYNWSLDSDGQFKRGMFVLHCPGRDANSNPDKSLLETRIDIFTSDRVKNDMIYD